MIDSCIGEILEGVKAQEMEISMCQLTERTQCKQHITSTSVSKEHALSIVIWMHIILSLSAIGLNMLENVSLYTIQFNWFFNMQRLLVYYSYVNFPNGICMKINRISSNSLNEARICPMTGHLAVKNNTLSPCLPSC